MNASKFVRYLCVTVFFASMTFASAQLFKGAMPGPGDPDQAVGITIGSDQSMNLHLRRAGFPRINFAFGGFDYFAINDLFSGFGRDMTIQLNAGMTPGPIVGGNFTIAMFVDNTGVFSGGVGGDDFSLTGNVDVDGDGIIDVSGLLLTGEATSFNAINGAGGIRDMFMMSFQVTGGQMAADFGSVINIALEASVSSFFGQFLDDFKLIVHSGTIIGKGQVCTGSIGNYVWSDENGDGIQDDNEDGINGVTVSLTNSNGDVTTVVTTTGGPDNAPGYYQFSMLCAGDYIVAVDLNTVPVGFVPTLTEAPAGTPQTDSNDPNGTLVNLPTDDSTDQDSDFGFVELPASLGDFVWLDENEDGIQDPGEVGVEGVTVNLLACSGAQLMTTMTDNTGFYEFTDLPPGCYKVTFILPNGFEFSPQFAGGDPTADSNANPITGMSDEVTLAAGDNDPTIDAGIFEPANSSLGDFVWDDVNMDGIQDPGEIGIENVMVNLLDCAGNVLDTTTTDNTGFYEFTDLTAGCYEVQFILPAGYVFSPQDAGNDNADSDANTATGLSGQIDLGVNENNPTIDAGMFLPVTASLGDFFWMDTNGDGIQDPGEPGIEGVNVELFDCAGVSLGTTMTGAGGIYSFTDLDGGCYYVVFEPPANCVLSPQGAGGDTTVDSNADPVTGQTPDINLAAGDTDITIDAGCYFTAGLGDFVWLDSNQDGIQDPGEDGIPGLLVELLDMNMNPTGMTDVTGPNGEYAFNDLAPGKYFVQFSAPAGHVFTVQDAGGDDAADSDANGTGKSAIIMLDSGEFDPTIDAGVYLPENPSIDIEKSTNGFDADDPTGPYIPVGETVTWEYVVTNTGNVLLTNIVVTDNILGVITCPFTELHPNGGGVSEMTCTATGTAEIGQYVNQSDVVGDPPIGPPVVDDDPSHYFGSNPGIDIEKATNGEDADLPTGPLVPVGGAVNWTYVVMNTGNVTLTNVTVTDTDPGVTVDCPLSVLQPLGQGVSEMTCTATGIAVLGQYENDSDVVGTPPVGPPVTDDDPSHYFGVNASIDIEKTTNGIDADDPNAGDAPPLEPGDAITWLYTVTNTGNVDLTDVGVIDSQGVVVVCPMDTLMANGGSMICEGVGVAIDLGMAPALGIETTIGICGTTPGALYTNTGVATGTTPGGMTVTADDPSHYCNPNVCAISVDGTCLIPMPPAGDYVCEKPIDSLTFIWNGAQSVRIKAYKGAVGSQLLADIDDIMPGQEISVSGYAGSPNDVFFQVFTAGTSTLIGQSKFHLSCSDGDMNGPEDCGLPQGNGKDNGSSFINNWLLEGIVDQGGVLDCTAAPASGADSCNFQSFPANCDTIENVQNITLVYTGGTCAASQNDQGSKFHCTGTLDPTLPALVLLGGGGSFFVNPGESFILPKDGSGTEFSMSNAGGMMNLEVHMSCSAPLQTGDTYGATTMTQINGMGEGTDVIYSYTITNTGETDIVDLMANDIPLGPVPGLPSFLGVGDQITLFNTGFVGVTTTSTVIVDAVDVNGASCSAQDMTTVSILPPPPCDIVGEGVIDIDHDKVKWRLTNNGSSTATIESITITYPVDVHGALKEVKFDGTIYKTNTTGPTITLGPANWINDEKNRRLNPGDDRRIEFVFVGHNHGEYSADAYQITINYEQGCSVTFVNTGLPNVCTKPISQLSMIWDGTADPIRVKAWKGSVGSQLLLDQSGINIGTEVTVPGYAGSPNDVYWEIFSGGTKIGDSNFHMSCSDSNMNGADDCGKREGNGKSDSNILINDWLFEGFIDADGPVDCTP